MALLESIHVPLKSKMPNFILKDPNGKQFSGKDLYGKKGLLVAFTCNHCPYALAIWPRLIRLASYAKKFGIHTAAINPNIHPQYPDDAPPKMLEKIEEWGIDFPYLVDESQKTAKDFKAQCTPDLYLFNDQQELVYHGRLDDNWQNESKVTKEELKEAIDLLVANKAASSQQRPSMGCSIKWRS